MLAILSVQCTGLWSLCVSFSPAAASMNLCAWALFEMMWSIWCGRRVAGWINVMYLWAGFSKKVVMMARSSCWRYGRKLVPAGFWCGRPKGPSVFLEVFPEGFC